MAKSKLSPKPPSNPPADLVVMGRIFAPRGIKGWVKIKTFTELPDALAEFRTWWLRDGEGWKPCVVEESELVHLGFSAKLQGVEDRSDAELMRGLDVAVSREELPKYDDSIYWIDLIGLQVNSQAGENLGRIESLLETGANDVMMIKREDGKEMLVPYSAQTVIEVDLQRKLVVVDWQGDWL